jgi:beta-1,4-N-acetylglucosaminyltransferase
VNDADFQKKHGKKSRLSGIGDVMIFVTVGQHYQGFERLIKKMDEIAGKIEEDIIMQIGSTPYKPRNAKYFEFIEDNGITELFNTARIIITHAGSGTLLDLIRLKRPFIIVPRLKKFNEHIDDQQIELADALSGSYNVVSIYDIEDLEKAILNFNPAPMPCSNKNLDLINFLKKTITKF